VAYVYFVRFVYLLHAAIQ